MPDPTPDRPHVYTLKELNAEGDAIQAFLRGEGPCLGCEERERERDEALILARRLAGELADVAYLAKAAMKDANRNGAEYAPKEDLAEAYALLASPSVLSLLSPAAPPR